jgi:hypothetical protein
VPSPHVTRAVVSTTAGTAQPLTCGRPRQTGRTPAISWKGSVSAEFVGTGIPAAPPRKIGRVSGAANSRDSQSESPIIATTAVRRWYLARREDVRGAWTGELRGAPRRRGCAGDFSAGQGEGFPLIATYDGSFIARSPVACSFGYAASRFRQPIRCATAAWPDGVAVNVANTMTAPGLSAAITPMRSTSFCRKALKLLHSPKMISDLRCQKAEPR